MNHLGLSGGSTKGAFHVGVIFSLFKRGYKPDVISGISVGAILALPASMLFAKKTGPMSQIRKMFFSLRIKDMFNQPPLNDKGKITLRAMVNIITRPYLGRMERTRDKLKEMISKEDYDSHKEMIIRGEAADVFIGAVNEDTSARTYGRMSDLEYDDFFDLVLASASIPVFTKAVMFKGSPFVDGGVRDHSPTAWVIQNVDGVTSSVSVYSRNQVPKLNPYRKTRLFPIINRLVHTLSILMLEISKSDESLEDSLCQIKGVKQVKVFCPHQMSGWYSTDQAKIMQLYHSGLVRGTIGHKELGNN